MVVVSDGEPDFVAGELAETSRDRFLGISRGRGGLIDVRCAEANVSVAGGEDEIAGIARIPRNDARGSAREAQRNLVWVGAGSDAEVVFELSLIAVINQVDTGINRLILDAGKLRNVTMPLGRIVANEVAALARQRRSAGNTG